ncbi:Crp/Fnr family transcriptional regulator [Edaphobacter bradus]|uniref:Crp/Fnr family transcriptional regulator n=1 Tax=Edaphobacter bradus TaxID=2259016 RepID=UPI00295C072D|nr:Crp/Fnr family transcriptional regulator [Edaphobacter bradus]
MFRALGTQDPIGNRLLWSLSEEEYVRLHLEHATLKLGQVLYECGERIDYAYFPTTCVVSCLYTMQDGSTAEMALAGNEGVIGVALFLGGGNIPHRAVAQIGGHALKMPAKVLQEEFARGGTFQRTLLRYTQALITQISQTAVCNRLHPIEQRLCRWLLLCHNRVYGSEILMTQEFIANLVGGRRESVTVAAGRLQDAGLIHYSRGHIKVLDRKGLEATVCECYSIVEDEMDRLVGACQRKQPQRQEALQRSLWRRSLT